MNFEFKKNATGSLTVEAALVMPIFLLGLLSLLYIMQAINLHGHVNTALYNMAKEYSAEAYFSKKAGMSQIKSSFEDYADDEIDKSIGLINGKKSIDMTKSSYMKYKESIVFAAEYTYKVPTPFFKNYDISMINRACVRGFTGNEDLFNNNCMVYVAKNGTVYHLYYDCTYLKIKINKVKITDIDSKRNSSGAKYYPCTLCDDVDLNEVTDVYISSYGTAYHYSSTCSSIMRNVTPVNINNVSKMRVCKKCQNRSKQH